MDAQTPVAEVTVDWVRGRLARREINDVTARTYSNSLRHFTNHVGGNKPVGEITIIEFESWLASCDLKPSSLNTRAAPIRAMFEWMARRQIVPINPTRGVARARMPKRYPRSISDEEVRQLLLVADFRCSVIILLALHLGLRRSEIAGMNIEHWDRVNDLLRVIGKGDKERILPMRGEPAEALALWVGNRRSGPVFPSQQADRIGANQVGDLVTNTAARAGVKATTHSLRHTFASRLVAEGVPLNAVQALMGHESLNTTSIYVTAAAKDLIEYIGNTRWVL